MYILSLLFQPSDESQPKKEGHQEDIEDVSFFNINVHIIKLSISYNMFNISRLRPLCVFLYVLYPFSFFASQCTRTCKYM